MKNKNLLKSMILPIGRAMKKARALLLLCTLLLMNAHAWGSTEVTWVANSADITSITNRVDVVVGSGTKTFTIKPVRASGTVQIAWESSALKFTDNDIAKSGVAIYFPSTVDDIEKIEFYMHGSRKTYYASDSSMPTKGTATGSSIAASSTSYQFWSAPFSKNYYYAVGGHKDGSGNDFIDKIVVTFAGGNPRIFKSNEKIYFKDASGNLSFPTGGAALWKVSTGDLFAEFYDDEEHTAQVTAGKCVTGDDKWNLANSIYRLVVPQLNSVDHEWTGVRFKRGSGATIWHTTQDQTPDIGKNMFMIANESDDGGLWKGTWNKYSESPALIGDFNNWDPDANVFSDYSGNVGETCFMLKEASHTYSWKVLEGESYYCYDNYKAGWTLTATTTTEQQLYPSGNDNSKITSSEVGEYKMKYDKKDHKFKAVYYPRERLVKGTYIYFDARSETNWNSGNFDARFGWQYHDTGSEQSWTIKNKNTALENWVYYAQVPENNSIGRIQMKRLNPEDQTVVWCTANVVMSTSKSSNAQNCIKEEAGKANYCDSWTPQWTTYCPPMSSATLSDNSTTKVSWQTGNGTSGSPYLVEASGTIKVSASATSAVPDPVMTAKYDFQVSDNGGDASSGQSGTGTKYEMEELTTGHTYEISLETWNNYNSTDGTKYTSAAHLWYKAVTLRDVQHTLSHVTCTGGREAGTGQAADGEAFSTTFTADPGYNLPSDVTVKFGETKKTKNTDYTWNSSTGVLVINAASYGATIKITVTGEAKTTTIKLDDNDENHGASGDGTASVNYDATAVTSITYTEPATGYQLKGYYTAKTDGYKVLNADGTFATYSSNISSYISSSNKWCNESANVTLYAQYEIKKYTVSFVVSPAGYGSVSPTSISNVEHFSAVSIDGNALTLKETPVTATPEDATAEYTYTFSSWSVKDKDQIEGTTTITATFAQTANSYTLAWDLNGSDDELSGTYDSGTTAYGTSIAKPNDPTWAGHTFSKWNSADDGSGDDYSGTMPAAHTTYYAQWTANKYNVAFTLSNAAYSSGTDEGDNVATCGTDYEVVFAATSGYVFPSDITVTIGASSTTKGTQYAWDASTGALTVYGSYIVGNIDISITAEAEVTTYSVTYDGDEPTSGSAPSGGSDYEGGETIVVADDNNMSKDDYTFRGWSDGTTFFLPGQSFTMPTDNVTLTAVWEPTSSGGGGSTIYKFQVKTGLGSSASNIDKSVTDASTYMSVLEGGTIPMSLSGNGNIQTKNDSALCLHSTSGLLKPTLTSPKEIQRGDIIKYRSTSNEIRLMVSTTYTATTDVTMPAGNKMVVTSSSMIGQSALNMTQKSSDAEIKYFEIYRPGEVLFYAEVNNGIGTGNIGSGTDETEQTAGAVASGHKLSYISGGKLYTKARSAGYVKGATNEIQLTDGASGTYIKVALDKALAEGDIILVNSIAQTYPLGITTSATYSTAIVGPYYVIPAESGMIGEKNIYLWRNSSNSNLRTVAVVRPGSGADTNFDVTFANGSNVDPAPSTYHWTELPDEIIGVPDGDKIVEPETEPEAVGYDFGGWYKEAACTNAWTFTSDAVTSDKTLYAKWTTNVRHFIGGVSGHEDEWGQTGNWEEGELPNRNSIVYITAPLKIVHGETPRHVGRVIIVTGGDYTPDGGEERTCTGKIDIEYNAALIVKTYVKRCADAANIADPSKYEPTAEADLHIGASPYAANGALVMVEHDGTNNAVVDFAPLSGYQEKYEDLLNQFVGTPFNDHGAVIQDYYYCWLSSVSYTYSLDGSPKYEPNWEWMNSDDGMEPFWGYDLTSYNPANSVFNMTGTLVETENQDITLYNKNNTATFMENLLANSWTAPIQISAFKASDFVNADAVIYIFNSAKTDDITGNPTSGTAVDCAGTYTCLPINLAGNRTIPSMQSFSVLATTTPAEGTASVHLNYKRLVYDPAASGIHLEPNHAPRRNEMVATESNDAPENMKLHVKGVSTYGDYVWMVVRDDFSEGRDNGWEARMLQGTGEAPQIYTIREIGNMSIDAVNDLEGTVLGFHKGTKDDTYTFHFEYDGWQTWYLNDLKEQKSTLIDSEETYMFTSAASDTEARFVISATPINAPAVVTDIDNVNDGTKARKMIINDQMYIIIDGKIYDATGKAVK